MSNGKKIKKELLFLVPTDDFVVLLKYSYMHLRSDITGGGTVGAEGLPLLLAGILLHEHKFEAVDSVYNFFHVNLPGVCFYIGSPLKDKFDPVPPDAGAGENVGM